MRRVMGICIWRNGGIIRADGCRMLERVAWARGAALEPFEYLLLLPG